MDEGGAAQAEANNTEKVVIAINLVVFTTMTPLGI